MQGKQCKAIYAFRSSFYALKLELADYYHT
jgi:hypothetical protein